MTKSYLAVSACALSLSMATLTTFAIGPALACGGEGGGLKFKTEILRPVSTEASVEKAVAEIDKLAQKQIDDAKVPGLALAVVYKDKVVFAKGYGKKLVADQSGKNLSVSNNQIDADTVFQIASISKSVASTVVAAVVGEKIGEKIISWDSKVSDLDPAFALSDPFVTANLTVRDLFCHRSGLPSHAGDPLEDMGYTQTEVLHRLRYQKPSSSFRAGYAYTNFGLTEGALAATIAAKNIKDAKNTKDAWADLSTEKLYRPLGMTATSSRFDDFWGRENKAYGHMKVDGKWVHKKQRQPDAQSPAGGCSTSVNDLAKWMRLQLGNGKFEGKQIIDESAIAETHKPHMLTGMSPLSGRPDFYGLGFNVSYDKNGRLVLGHSGAFVLGAGTNVRMIPAEQLGICVVTNGSPVGVAEGLANTFTDSALYGAQSQDWLALFAQIFADPATLGENVGDYTHPPAAPRAALANDVYSGVYENEFWGEVKVSEVDGKLTVLLGKDLSVPLKHYDRDTFTFELTCEDLGGVSAMTFAISPDGKGQSVLVENLNENGNGTFTRRK